MNHHWTTRTPTEKGFYEVRMLATAWGLDEPIKTSRIIYFKPRDTDFDAGHFGGKIHDPLWEWRGPIEIPDSLPEDVKEKP